MPYMLAKKNILPVLLALAVLLVWAPAAQAHKVYLFAWVEGDTVLTDSYFSKSKKVMGGKVEVFDPSGEKLLEGLTDDQGAFAFAVPRKTDLRIVVTAGMGHKGEFLLAADELPDSVASSEAVSTEQSAQPTAPAAAAPQNASAVPADLEQMKKIMAETLDARIKPLERAIADLKREEGPSLTDIIGGLGYIFGLMGLAMYLRQRRRG